MTINIIIPYLLPPRWNLFTAAKDRLASSQESHAGILNLLARRGNTSVQQRVAENTSTDSATLDLLSQHQSPEVKSAVAQNAHTSESTTNTLAADIDVDVRYAMAENSWTSARLLLALTQDENPFVQHRARRTIARLEVQALSLIEQNEVSLG